MSPDVEAPAADTSIVAPRRAVGIAASRSLTAVMTVGPDANRGGPCIYNPLANTAHVMSDDSQDGLEEVVSDFLSGSPADPEATRRDEMLAALQDAAERLDESPTVEQYRRLDTRFTADEIKNTFGKWNTAKEKAGLETVQRGTLVDIDETYFASIGDPETAYWLGTLIARSSLNRVGDEYTQLMLGRVETKEYFIRELMDAIGADYRINSYPNDKSDKNQVQAAVSNPTFIDHLVAAGYPGPDDGPGGFPDLPESLQAPFVRGFLESSGYFSTNGWSINLDTTDRAERMQAWLESFGAKRVTLSESADGTAIVRVANPFDIRAIYDTCWPNQLATEPSYTPYAEKIRNHLQDEHPYPDNVEYLDG